MQIAFLGTGVMGAPMARNLAAAGHDVHAGNRTREKAEALQEHGVRVADSPEEAVDGAEAIVTMLSDAAATREVAGQAIPAAPEGSVWWQAGTLGLEGIEELAGLAREHGVAFVDGPVLGTRQPAEDGKLIVLLSGADADQERVAPLLEPVSTKVVELGGTGDGTRLKLVLNHWL